MFTIMARPVKNYCDYFPHDGSMRNHRKIKAIRTKFGITGYAIWNMILEYLTGTDGNEFENSDVEVELMAGDFGVSAPEIRQLVDYCIRLELLFDRNGFIHSETLDERLLPVYTKRGARKDNSSKQRRINGKFATNNTVSNGVSAPEMPQKKRKEIKGNKTINGEAKKNDFEEILNPSSFPTWRSECSAFLKDDYYKNGLCKDLGLPLGNVEELMREFVKKLNLENDFKNTAGLKVHFVRHYQKHKNGKEFTAFTHSKGFIEIPDNIDYDKMEKW